jgi:adenylosuccinate synthase
MRKAFVVIGAGFGDEGKGLITDYLARQVANPLVVRFNGGGQAGHTVVDGERHHIFGHVGAGSFAGASTYLSKNFIVNPLLAERELRALWDKGVRRSYVDVHPEAQVTTIYDMAINTLVELARGNNRHGSCGLGINETVTRGEKVGRLTVGALQVMSDARLHEVLKAIAEVWVPQRLAQFNLFNGDVKAAQRSCQFIEVLTDHRYHHHAEALRRATVEWCYVGVPALTNESIIMEGAQGLRLDEFLGKFPHVTRSVTGLPYAWQAAAELDVTELQPIYVTRCYTTRHGAGPLPYEGEFITDRDLWDTTNVFNPWQGQLRYAPLDVDALNEFIDRDLERSHNTRKPLLAVTCLDQLGGGVRVIVNRKHHLVQTAGDLVALLEREVNLKVALTSFGPSAQDVRPTSDFFSTLRWYNTSETEGLAK